MKPKSLHPWEVSPAEARHIQQDLSTKVIREDCLGTVTTVAGVDVAYTETSVYAAVVVLCAETLAVVDSATAVEIPTFPYIPGLFSFREIPSISAAMARLTTQPDLIVCDGHGIAHPAQCGLASHVGILYDLPTIGCAKSLLWGEAAMPGEERGNCTPITDGAETIGAVLRTQSRVKPVYVSIGHKISLPTACAWVLSLAPRYRLPETTRQANHCANALRSQLQ